MQRFKTPALSQIYDKHPLGEKIANALKKSPQAKLATTGLLASARSLFLKSCFDKYLLPTLVILDDKESAAYFYDDLVNVAGNQDVLFFPSSYKRSVQYNKIDSGNLILRTEVLNRFRESQNPAIVVSYPSALIEKVVTKESLETNTLQLKTGEALSTSFVVEVLTEYQFERVDFVYEPGQFAVRGGIIDIFSFANDYPFRIDFFGDEVESIRTFDVQTQLSKAKFGMVNIIPNLQNKHTDQNRVSFFDFIPPQTAIWASDLQFLFDRLNELYEKTTSKNKHLTTQDAEQEEVMPENLLITGAYAKEKAATFRLVEMGHSQVFEPQQRFELNTSAQPSFQKNFELLNQSLFEKQQLGYATYILSEGEKQIERLKSILQAQETHEKASFEPIMNVVHEGFCDHDLKICCYTDHQIFQRYHKFKLRNRSQTQGKEALTLREIHDLHPGDFVVHVDHGIGRFGGLQKVEINGKQQEAIRLIYKDNDALFVSIHSLHRISKYKGKDGSPPKIYKLGSNAWQKLKQRTKRKVKDIAKELIALYAKRKANKGFGFSQDSYLQQALEASFIYEDTPDQLKATQEVKSDMESPTPMDRLVCGDVGFGKTEVAIRAAFKAVADSKQVAVLVPTTILALQHYKTFQERLKDLPCNVDYISRLKKTKQIKESLKKTAEGKTDVLIGTHRILSKDVNFKNLGLLIIDEEQKFGVAKKEKLKSLKINVDTLTLTATPIPRTLEFSLMGARDLSIIQTPPPNRYPIVTELHTFNEDIIREAITYEIERNGQVFFIHNRVQNIYEVEALINRICPEARTVVAHGQMDGAKLEKIMLDFINEEYGVLIATTIIENGLDIPNANTIIINNAQNFGLSDLHQLRGRVGRSNKKAFCYLLAPPMTVVTPEARRRLKAISDFSELGSGFNIALQDLDIRGAGNLLGGEQSGFISDIGFETYHRILDEALLELRENEYKNLFDKKQEQDKKQAEEKATPLRPKHLDKIKFVSDCQIDTDLEILFPESYIQNISERFRLYRELDNIKNEEELQKFQTQLTDRFGKIPPQSLELLQVVRLRWKAIELGFEKIILKNQTMICHFIANQESAYYRTQIFTNILQFVQNNPKICQIKQTPKRLSARFDNVKSIGEAKKILDKMS